jgi:hypothetical protein
MSRRAARRVAAALPGDRGEITGRQQANLTERIGQLQPSDIDMTRHSIRLRATKSGHAQTRGLHSGPPMTLWRAG